MKGISGSTLKIIALLAMLIDHIAAVFLNNYLLSNGFDSTIFQIQTIMRMVGRLGFPIFIFLMIEGFFHTRSVAKYALRLGVFAFATEVIFDLAFKRTFFYPGYQNVFFTLLIGLLTIWWMRTMLEKDSYHRRYLFLFPISILLTGLVFCYLLFPRFCRTFQISIPDGQQIILACIFSLLLLLWMLYAGRAWDTEFKIRIGITLLVMLPGVLIAEYINSDYAGYGVMTIAGMFLIKYFGGTYRQEGLAGCTILAVMNITEFTAFFAVIPLNLYNGTRGLRMKYFFYLFYPVHLLLLYLLSVICGYA